MKKILMLFAAFLGFMATGDSSFAKYNQKHGADNSCWYETEYKAGGHGSGNWAYYFCGKTTWDYCDNKECKGHDTCIKQVHGDSFTFKGGKNPSQHTASLNTYWCCNGTKDARGVYVPGKDWIVDSRIEVVPVGNGTCNQLVQIDICGEEHRTPEECTVPDPEQCNEGTIFRNGECAVVCTGNQFFESLTSNKCITCEPTKYQGVVTRSEDVAVDGKKVHMTYQTCLKCDEGSELFDRDKQTCVAKTDIAQYSKVEMKECWKCSSSATRKLCLQARKSAINAGKTSREAILKYIDSSTYDKIKSCFL